MSFPVYAVAGLGYGDEGKGTVVDWLCSQNHGPATVIRFNGGGQAAHNVVMPDGRHHTFSQFGSGTLRGARTYLSQHMLVDPLALFPEARHLQELGIHDPLAGLIIDPRALIATPYHREANRKREEARGEDRHGSCGVGIGETAAYALQHPDDAPRVADCNDYHRLHGKLSRLRERLENELGPLDCVMTLEAICSAYQRFDQQVRIFTPHYGVMSMMGPIIFEGAQGVLLDEKYGFHPYTTWSNTTFGNAMEMASGAGLDLIRIGVSRTYMTRHGAGPLVTEDPGIGLAESYNGSEGYQGSFRQGHLDLVALRYAVQSCGGADLLAITHTDALGKAELKQCISYRLPGEDLAISEIPFGGDEQVDIPARKVLTESMLMKAAPVYRPSGSARLFLTSMSEYLELPVIMTSWGPTAKDKAQTSMSFT